MEIFVDINYVSTISTISLISAWYFFGLIWLVQLSIYPHLVLLCQHCPQQWANIHNKHSAVMGAFAGAPMIIQLVAALGLSWLAPQLAQHHSSTISCANLDLYLRPLSTVP